MWCGPMVAGHVFVVLLSFFCFFFIIRFSIIHRLPHGLFMLRTSFSPWTVFCGMGLLRPQSSPPHQRGRSVSLPPAPPRPAAGHRRGAGPSRRIRHQDGVPSPSVRPGTFLLPPTPYNWSFRRCLCERETREGVLCPVRSKSGRDAMGVPISKPSSGCWPSPWCFRWRPDSAAGAVLPLATYIFGRRMRPSSVQKRMRPSCYFWLRHFPDLQVLRHPPIYIFRTREPFVMVPFRFSSQTI
jgi:hypothetical protein